MPRNGEDDKVSSKICLLDFRVYAQRSRAIIVCRRQGRGTGDQPVPPFAPWRCGKQNDEPKSDGDNLLLAATDARNGFCLHALDRQAGVFQVDVTGEAKGGRQTRVGRFHVGLTDEDWWIWTNMKLESACRSVYCDLELLYASFSADILPHRQSSGVSSALCGVSFVFLGH